MFQKILIANRGEIACRVIKTAQRLGIRTVAIYSNVDHAAQHVQLADEAYCIGAAPVAKSYLQAEKIIAVAKTTGAQAIHPGYGFLSENVDFADLCERNNITFIGPPSSAIRAMGSKSAAKEIMASANVPLVPGYYGQEQDSEFLLKEAEKIGFPVLLKASAGGGGKGMRIVHKASDFNESLTACQREALSSFGDDHVILEKYIEKPRHIEIQVFADTHGNCVHLFERDCSLQRRYQKVIEEAPAPNLAEDTREQMGQVAINAAKAINYVGAGTVEFLYADGSFYFMEMNTRLQVEHPVTEKITQTDLVEWQLRVASGEPLPKTQQQLAITGHAFEIRLYAETPENDFLPATGRIAYMQTPTESQHVRIDSGVIQGDEISVYYDPMIAKLVVWGETRNSALSRLRGALADYQIVGFSTNIDFTANIIANQAFEAAELSTHFIDEHLAELLTRRHDICDEDVIVAALFDISKQMTEAQQAAQDSNQSNSPWHNLNGWRNNLANSHICAYHRPQNEHDENTLSTAEVHFEEDHFVAELNDQSYIAKCCLDGNQFSVQLPNKQLNMTIVEVGNELYLLSHARQVRLQRAQIDFGGSEENQRDKLVAPMHGSIISIDCQVGDHVQAGQSLMIMEAMKMEHSIQASTSGEVTEIIFQVGELVEEGDELVRIEAHDG
ncbi:MAG: acetyl/propionyl/methylcrotonyl-CoA carboxylase subunit alpha [Enterobacterales bacterium]|nr:acetyl/propionyl/methylcrotonyl-CoA carboxylase subunit alpha [Enterobacterales bacterium]